MVDLKKAAPLRKLAGEAGLDLVLIHGFGADRLSWLANAPVLGAHFNVWGLDLPGHGDAPPAQARSLDDLAALAQAAIEASPVQGVHLAGHSLGGAIALALACAMPERVRSLTLIAPAGLGQNLDQDFVGQFASLRDVAAAEALLQRLVTRPRLISRQMVARVLDHLEKPGIRQELAAIGAVAVHAEKPVEDLLARLPAALPRLVVWGGEDRINPMDSAKVQAAHARMHVLPDAGHMPHVEEARAFNEIFANFLMESR